ncbi:MAG: class I SAM-dependent methyltransferase [Gammaproteobacteria bacterium]|nr:class I SAM-dependent methyltransferase [Gammaproteobacteria bacterium]
MLNQQLEHTVKLAIRRSPIALVLRKLFRRTSLTAVIELGQEQSWKRSARCILFGPGKNLLSNPDLHEDLRNHINTDIPAEFLLTEIRRQILYADTRMLEEPVMQEFITSMIQQAINNEYVWLVTESERERLATLKQKIVSADPASPVQWSIVAQVAMYVRLNELPAPGVDKNTFLQSVTAMPATLEKLLNSYLDDYEEEQAIKNSIESADGAIHNSTSRMIADNYEAYPYPRWIHLEMPSPPVRRNRLAEFFDEQEIDFVDRPFKVLVAGCGTGNKVIQYAMSYGNLAEILAIDLSKASIAYATRMARKLGITNIRFMQMDLLDLYQYEKYFDIVECTGVLHHLKDPLEGGRALVSSARDGGIVHLSLYSELARRQIMNFREKYQLAPDATDDEIRAKRYRMMQDDPAAIDERLSLRWDFFDLNRCKDLLFHPLEHRFTVPQLGEYLAALELEFRGLERPDYVRNQYWTRYPDASETRNLAAWHSFELRHPDAFGSLYEIWARKPGCGV